MIGSEKLLSTNVLIVFDSLDAHSELLMGALLLSCGSAKKECLPLIISSSESLKSELLGIFPEEVRQCLLEHGEAVLDAVKIIDLTAKNQIIDFTCIALCIGANVAMIEALHPLHLALMVAVPQTDAELLEINGSYPYAFRAHHNVESSEVTESSMSQYQWFMDRYVIIKQGHFNPQSDIEELGKGQAKICRYCGNDETTGKFINISHAFPEQIGNKKLVDLLECDDCNKHFSLTLDDHFGKWSRPERSMGVIKGKKNKIPSYRSADEKVIVTHKAGIMKLDLREGDDRLKFDIDKQTLQIQFEKQPYVPMAIFKSFVKMALAVMPEPVASECAHLKSWILEETHSVERFQNKPLMLLTQFAPGRLPPDKISYCVILREENTSDCPYLQFILGFSNYVYQIALPMPQQDSTEYQVAYFPHPLDTPERENQDVPIQYLQSDLSSIEVRKSDKSAMNFRFDEAEEKNL